MQVTDEKEAAESENKKEDWYLVRGIATRPPGEALRNSAITTTIQPGDERFRLRVGWWPDSLLWICRTPCGKAPAQPTSEP